MSFDIEITGVDDLEDPWKLAFCGFPGSGKTMLSSTAPDPYYLFFREHPRYKSIVSRGIPHTKVLNIYDGTNHVLVESVQDRLLEIIRYLRSGEHEFKTLVVDTGDEMFQAMKEARIAANNGEWNISDWGWIGDAYREIVNAMIDLPMHVIFLFHVKTTLEDDLFVRELALQGAAKDEAAGWFDVVGALESITVTDDDGNNVTKRFVVTQPSRAIPWAKDHSGKLPSKLEISRDFQGDIPRILEKLSTATGDISANSEVYKVVGEFEEELVEAPDDVITPDKIRERKAELKKGPAAQPGEQQPAPAGEEAMAPEVSSATDEQKVDEAVEMVQAELGGKEIVTCVECGAEVEDENIIEMSKMKYDKVYCKSDFKVKIKS